MSKTRNSKNCLTQAQTSFCVNNNWHFLEVLLFTKYCRYNRNIILIIFISVWWWQRFFGKLYYLISQCNLVLSRYTSCLGINCPTFEMPSISDKLDKMKTCHPCLLGAKLKCFLNRPTSEIHDVIGSLSLMFQILNWWKWSFRIPIVS